MVRFQTRHIRKPEPEPEDIPPPNIMPAVRRLIGWEDPTPPAPVTKEEPQPSRFPLILWDLAKLAGLAVLIAAVLDAVKDSGRRRK